MNCTAETRIQEDPRWRAVAARDPAADGDFVYSVRTTGVYCRPSCPSRAAAPRNVRFHADAAAAERAGFRPCRRCRPDQAPPGEARAQAAARACRRIETAEAAPSLAVLAAEAGLSPHHFHRLFKAAVGLTPAAYARAVRAERLRAGLAEAPTVTAAAYDAGFGSSGRLYAASGAALGMTPTAWRAGGAGEVIRFALGTCTLGRVLVAASGSGVCAVLLGDDAEALVADLRARFPRAALTRGDAALEALVAHAIAVVDAPAGGSELPLDLRGTAFQKRVWAALQAVRPGETVTYAELAARIGAPSAVRAVAAACAANPVAVAVPCHRVVRRDGGLAGYRWGLERKRRLLDLEADEGAPVRD